MNRPDFATILEYMKPITWFAPMWAFGCGLISSGFSFGSNWQIVVAGVLLAGPMVCGTSQAVNDWYDRHVDAINEPNRPIPSGRLPGNWGFYISVTWTILSLILATTLGFWGFAAATLGLILAWMYSAPPFRLKQNGWWGNLACGLAYEGLPWITAAAIIAAALPDWRILTVALLYSLGAHGIMTLNDFKSVEGDIKMGVRSLPVQLGVRNAAWLACVVMALPQVIVIGLLVSWDSLWHAGIVSALLVAQFVLMRRFLGNPREQAIWYNATGTTLYVLGMLVTAFALRPLLQGQM
ncbi:chlorophyll synthase ChlG [Rhodomicrobium lacus]|jgi:chlorophyll synthase|uniref:chlorophyll synthase ChlG n=1 Tax=Rhodomicrobium lacus TaxID=2498452 RepID=UPI000F8C9D0E|nr:chlorophyll synthase ChlG [Rhodomicrobium lacus]WKW51537.1 chlorophyll synthase ChlG [Rhodomicrobium lacus]